MPFTPQELAAEHARAMRIVKAVLTACDARAATAKAARDHNLKPGDAPWVLAIGKAAIGMAEGLKDVCGEPHQHLIITVDGPPAISLTNILRSDHPLPTQRSLDAGQAVKRFIEEAKSAGAPALTVLISGGASSLICEPIPGIDLDEYRAVVQAMLTAGWNVQQMNTVRRAIDELKGGGLAQLAAPLPIDLLVISDVIGDTLHDIGSGPFVWSPTRPEDARASIDLLPHLNATDCVLTSLTCRPVITGLQPLRRAIIVFCNKDANAAAARAIQGEGFDVVSTRTDIEADVEALSWQALPTLRALQPGDAIAWSGEWSSGKVPQGSAGGRSQSLAVRTMGSFSPSSDGCILAFATDGVDGVPDQGRPPAAGAFVASGMRFPMVSPSDFPHDKALAHADACEDPEYAYYRWCQDNSYRFLAHHDATRAEYEPPAHIFTGPTGTNVNDLLIAWRVR